MSVFNMSLGCYTDHQEDDHILIDEDTLEVSFGDNDDPNIGIFANVEMNRNGNSKNKNSKFVAVNSDQNNSLYSIFYINDKNKDMCNKLFKQINFMCNEIFLNDNQHNSVSIYKSLSHYIYNYLIYDRSSDQVCLTNNVHYRNKNIPSLVSELHDDGMMV